MIAALIIFAALALDAWLGEPRRFHPLVGFGTISDALEQRLYADSRTRGVISVVLLLTPFALLAALTRAIPFGHAIDILLLYLSIGWNSLGMHAELVRTALYADDLPVARQRLGLIVSRDTCALDHQEIAKATVESVLENGNDAIFGAIFWYIIAGAPGVIVYRLTNTLDAMWGYRNEHYLNYGWAAARLDDILNFVPARLTALSYALVGNFLRAVRCWRTQGITWKSPNAGPVMASGAGSLGVVLGGPAMYQGVVQQRPPLGEGLPPDANDIHHALRLIRRTLVLWILALFAGGWLVDFIRGS